MQKNIYVMFFCIKILIEKFIIDFIINVSSENYGT